VLASPATRRATLTLLARFGFGARGLVYVLVGAFAGGAALGLGREPHGIMDAVQAVRGHSCGSSSPPRLALVWLAWRHMSPWSAPGIAFVAREQGDGCSPAACSVMRSSTAR